jgi:hypothetical protein
MVGIYESRGDEYVLRGARLARAISSSPLSQKVTWTNSGKAALTLVPTFKE